MKTQATIDSLKTDKEIAEASLEGLRIIREQEADAEVGILSKDCIDNAEAELKRSIAAITEQIAFFISQTAN